MKANRKAEQYIEKIKRRGEKVSTSVYMKIPKEIKDIIDWRSKYTKITDSEELGSIL